MIYDPGQDVPYPFFVIHRAASPFLQSRVYSVLEVFFMQKNRSGSSSVKLTVILSALSAIGIILGKFLAFNLTDFMRFSRERGQDNRELYR